MEAEVALRTGSDRGMTEGVDFFDDWVGHGKATDGNLVAMHHDGSSAAVVSTVVGVWVADIKCEVEGAVGFEVTCGNKVKTFRDLKVTFLFFWAEGARHRCNFVSVDKLILTTGA